MKLFVVIAIAGHVSGTIGPVPYGMKECRARAAAAQAGMDPAIAMFTGFTAADVRFACEWHRRRPQNDFRAPGPTPRPSSPGVILHSGLRPGHTEKQHDRS